MPLGRLSFAGKVARKPEMFVVRAAIGISPAPPPTGRFPQVGCYLEPPAQAVRILVDRCHLAVTLLAELRHRVHKTLDLQLSATGDKPALGRPSRLPPPTRVMPLLSQGKGAPLSGQERLCPHPRDKQSGCPPTSQSISWQLGTPCPASLGLAHGRVTLYKYLLPLPQAVWGPPQAQLFSP